MYANRDGEEFDLRYAGWRVAGAAAIGVFLSFASVLVYTFGVFLKPVSIEFGWSRQAASAAFGMAAVTVALCSPALGWLLDRYNPRRIIIPSVAVFGSAFASLSLLRPHLWHLYLVFIVLGAVANGTAQMAYARPIATWFSRRRGLALALMMSGGATGAIVLPPIAQKLIEGLGWRGAFAMIGSVVVMVGVPVAAVFVTQRPAVPSAGDGEVQQGATVREGLQSRVFWVTAAVLFIASLAQNATITHLPALLSDHGIRADRAAVSLSVLGFASLIGRVLTGYLLDRLYAPLVSACLLVLSACGTWILASASTLQTGCAGAALVGFGMGGEADVTPYLLARYLGLRSFAMLYGFTWSAYAIAGAAGPVLMGAVFDAVGSYSLLLACLTGCTLLAAALNVFIPRRVPRVRSSEQTKERSSTLLVNR